uniref:Putative secreted protein n=1 Tax=Ixodes ricinus TaxID=34613 RepID=A0A6B0V4I4_IXORI
MSWWRRDFVTRQAFLNLRFKNLLFILLFATADSSLFGPSHFPRRYFSRRLSQVQTGARPAPLTCKCFPLCFETTGIESLPNATEILPGVASSQLRLSETWRLARINRCKSKQAQTVRATHKSSLSASESPRRPAWKSAVEPTALTTTFAHRGYKVHPEQTHTKTEPRSHTQRRPAHTTQYDSLRTASPQNGKYLHRDNTWSSYIRSFSRPTTKRAPSASGFASSASPAARRKLYRYTEERARARPWSDVEVT